MATPTTMPATVPPLIPPPPPLGWLLAPRAESLVWAGAEVTKIVLTLPVTVITLV